jgi:signal peptidase II
LNKKLFITLLVFGVLAIDQFIKIWVKTNMNIGDEFDLMGQYWARIHFVENPGMAFGLTFGGDYGKLALSLFRIVAVGLLIYLILRLIRQNESFGLIACFGFILAGALGNIIDSAVYGLIFSASPEPFHGGGIAEMFPPDGGYAGFLHGKVVDMFYFPMWRGTFPSWVPMMGNESFEFFRPVFNFADASISVGVFSLLIFQRHFFQDEPAAEPVQEETLDSSVIEEEKTEETTVEENIATETNE